MARALCRLHQFTFQLSGGKGGADLRSVSETLGCRSKNRAPSAR